MKTRIKIKIIKNEFLGEITKYERYVPQIKVGLFWKELRHWFGNYEEERGYTDSRIIYGKFYPSGCSEKEYAQEIINNLKIQLEKGQGLYPLGFYPVSPYF